MRGSRRTSGKRWAPVGWGKIPEGGRGLGEWTGAEGELGRVQGLGASV